MGPLLSFLIGTISTLAVIFSGFDPDKAIAPIGLHCLAGLLVGLTDLKPRLLAVAAGLASFPLVLFAYLAISREVGNIWPIAMVINGVIAAFPFCAGYAIGLLMKVALKMAGEDNADQEP